MSSVKLFNFKYLMQNIKKSKGLIMLLTIVVPVITALILILYNSNSYATATTEGELAIVNIFGMFIIPFILSVALFGYVYDRKSVDFIGSMPINRTSIYVTNFLGGIILIAIIQLITLILIAILSLVLTNIYISMQLVLDIFIMMLFAYIFVFSAASLAMTISGNFLTQIVVTMLILFLIPFMLTISNFVNSARQLNIDVGNEIIEANELLGSDSYTLPYKMVTLGLSGSLSLYNVNSLARMILLTAVYFVLGIYLFNKRKMEDVEQSFSNMWEHLIVKALTLTPMVFIIMALDITTDISFYVAITLVFIYYIVYDFVTRKKVKIKYNIASFIVAFLILAGLYKGIDYINTTALIKNISTDEIAGFGLNMGISECDNLLRSEELNIIIDDENLVKEFCASLRDSSEVYNGHGLGYYNEKTARATSILDEETDMYKFPVYKAFKLKLKNGKEIFARCYVDSEFLSKFAKLIVEDEALNARYQQLLKFKNLQILHNGILMDRESSKNIERALNNVKLADLEYNDYSGVFVRTDSTYPYVNCYEYKNHEMINYMIDKELTDETFEVITGEINKQTWEKIENADEADINLFNSSARHISAENEELSGETTLKIQNVQKLLNYIDAHKTDKCNKNSSYFIFEFYGSMNGGGYYYLNETAELLSLLQEISYIEEPDAVVY